jgi:hypothetical protein
MFIALVLLNIVVSLSMGVVISGAILSLLPYSQLLTFIVTCSVTYGFLALGHRLLVEPFLGD